MEKRNPLGVNAIKISIYEAVKDNMNHSVTGYGRVRFFGILVMLLQLLVAAIPWIVYNEWGVPLIFHLQHITLMNLRGLLDREQVQESMK